MNDQILQLCGDVVLVVFALSALMKIVAFDNFIVALIRIPLIPISFVRLVALLIVVLEVVVVAGLFVNSDQARGLAIGLLVTFSLVSLYAVITGKEIACNCFGSAGSGRLGLPLVGRNLLLIGTVLLSYGIGQRSSFLLSPIYAAIFILFIFLIPLVTTSHRRLEDLVRQGYL